MPYASRTAIKALTPSSGDIAYLTEAGREGTFVFRAGDHSAFVARDAYEGIYLAPAAWPTGRAGAWVREHHHRWPIEWFGARCDATSGTDGTDNLAIVLSAALVANGGWPADADIPHGAQLLFGLGAAPGRGYRFSAGIDLRGVVELVGIGSTMEGHGNGTVFFFPAGTFGICLNNWNTDFDGRTARHAASSGGASLRSLYLKSDSAGASDLGKPGLRMRYKGQVVDCTFDGFPGPGVHIVANAGVGNANGFALVRCCAKNTASHGLLVEGNDANGGHAEHWQALQGVKGCGILDLSGLGNTYLAPQIDACGLADDGRVSHGGRNYVLIDRTPGIGARTRPGTDDYVWTDVGPTTSGAFTPWRGGASYAVTALAIGMYGQSNRGHVIGGYFEGYTGHLEVGTADGGQTGYTRYTAATATVATAGQARFYNNGVGGYMDLPGGNPLGRYAYSSVGCRIDDGILWEFGQEAVGHRNKFRFDGKDLHFEIDAAKVRQFGVSLRGTQMRFGTGTPQEGVFHTRLLGLGTGDNGTVHRIVRYGTAAPTEGAHALGEIVFDIAPAAGGKIGWVCVAAGTPGTWRAWGAIDA